MNDHDHDTASYLAVLTLVFMVLLPVIALLWAVTR